MAKIFLRGSVLIFVISLVFLMGLEHWARSFAKEGMYFQDWNSDTLMQALPVSQLQEKPFKSLLYLHKQTPGHDFIRMLITQYHHFRGVKPQRLLRKVDASMYWVWAVFYALQCALLFVWITKLANKPTGILAWVLWATYPGAIFCATLLDPTLTSSLVTIWFFYELWSLSNDPSRSTCYLALSNIAMFYPRSFYQWYFFPFVVLSLLMLRCSKRQIVGYIGLCALCIVPFLVKQYVLFGFLETSSIAGYHYCGAIWHKPTEQEVARVTKRMQFNYPEEAKGIEDRFNTEQQYKDNHVLKKVCSRYARKNPWEALAGILKSMQMNYASVITPASKYHPNFIVDNLFWREALDELSSGYMLLSFLGISILHWIYTTFRSMQWRGDLRLAGALLIPFLYTIFYLRVGNRYEWGEANRLRFILDPVVLVFVAWQLHALFRRVFIFSREFRNG